MGLFTRWVILIFCAYSTSANAWGFEPHRRINQQACLLLPAPLFEFYRLHIPYMMAHATDPDMRRYIDTLEAGRHFIDMEHYTSSMDSLPFNYLDAEKQFGTTHLHQEGNLPWNIVRNVYLLKKAFGEKNIPFILKISADLGHYVADAHVPLHTTENYNGQLSGQKGIHGLWETQVPELFMDTLLVEIPDFTFNENWILTIWECIQASHNLLPEVFSAEMQVRETLSSSKWHSFNQRKNKVEKTYSPEYRELYHRNLHGMVESRFRSASQLLSQLIFTAWVLAGEPELANIETPELDQAARKSEILPQDLNCDH